jgi:hypothetical protein
LPRAQRSAIVRGAGREGSMRRSFASLLSLCAALPAIGCAWLREESPEALARAHEVERALAVLRERLDLPVDAVAREIERVLPPVEGNLTPAGRQLLFDNEMVWLGVHQLIGFGEDRARIEAILARLAFDEHGPYFPAGMEGHPGQVTAALSRLGVDPDERFAVGDRSVAPADLVQSARDRFDHTSLREDPAWLIEAVGYGRDPTQGWVSLRGETTWVHGYILGRLRVLGTTNDLNAPGLAEGGLHFAESIGRLVPRLAAHPDFAEDGTTREAVTVYLRFLEFYLHTVMEPWLEQASRNLEPAQEAFRAAPSEETAQPFLRRLRDAGHILEIIHDPKSWFDGRISPVEQGLAAEKLAQAVLRWYGPEYEAARAALERIYDAEGRPRSLLCAGQMLHAYHGLSLWLASSRESALGPAPVVAERIVPLADGLPEADRARARDEVQAFLRVPRDAVEERAERPARREAHVLDGLVAE